MRNTPPASTTLTEIETKRLPVKMVSENSIVGLAEIGHVLTSVLCRCKKLT